LADEAEHGAGWGERADEVQTESYLRCVRGVVSRLQRCVFEVDAI
jgi:hypothetical protein